MSRKLAFTSLVLTAGLVIAACTDQPLTSPDALTSSFDALSVSPNFDANPVTDRVSAGGNDVCAAFGLPNGCDKNFSLHANMREDGTVTGQYQDGFPGGGEGIHATLDCLNVVGNGAVVSGVITNGTIFGQDVTGQGILTAVVDNGTSANDTPDQISVSFNDTGLTCDQLGPGNFPLFDLGNGQVTVRQK